MLLSLVLAGCAKQVALRNTVVTAASREEFTRFRAELGDHFPAEQLKDFDTATMELQLDAMNRDVATAAGREEDMVRVANGKSIWAVTLLGWQARKSRFVREIAETTRMLEHDLRQPQTESVTRRIGSEREVLDKLQANLVATQHHLAALEEAWH